MLKATDFEYGVVASRPDQMYGWPGITKVNDEHVIVSASERKYHVDPVGREVVIHSDDGGESWHLPQVVYNSELDDRDASLLTMPDGTVVLSWFTSTTFVRTVGDTDRIPQPWRDRWRGRIERMGLTDEVRQGWMVRSEDGGYTWGEALKTPAGHHAGPAATADGRLVYAGTANMEGVSEVFESRNRGDSWKKIGEIQGPKPDESGQIPFNENHIVETSSNHLLVHYRMKRASDDDMYLHQATSDDGGRTWTELQKTDIWGYPAHLIQLQSGATLSCYGHRRDPYSIRAVLSYDEGETWDTDNIITLYDFDEPCDMGYPVSVELGRGEILTVFYANLKERPGHDAEAFSQEPGGIWYVRWRLK
ncbi:MAG: sialidase family protein [Armatimonadota bacterium]